MYAKSKQHYKPFPFLRSRVLAYELWDKLKKKKKYQIQEAKRAKEGESIESGWHMNDKRWKQRWARNGGKIGRRLFHIPIFVAGENAMKASNDEMLCRLVMLQVWQERLAAEKGELYASKKLGNWGTGTLSFSRTGYWIVPHWITQNLQAGANHLLHFDPIFVDLKCRNDPHIFCLHYHGAVVNINLSVWKENAC